MNVPNATDSGARAPSLNDLLAVWPRRVQVALAAVLLIALSAITLHVLVGGLRDTRPTEVERNAFSTAPVELNSADQALLRQVPEVGEQLAERIVRHREANGPFRTVADLKDVPGIGKTKLDRLRSWVYVEDAEEEEGTTRRVSMSGKKTVEAMPVKSRKGEGIATPIELNEASAEELQKIPGIGPVLSAAIVQTRKVEAFRSVEDLRRVPGIGAKTLEKLRPYVKVTQKRSA